MLADHTMEHLEKSLFFSTLIFCVSQLASKPPNLGSHGTTTLVYSYTLSKQCHNSTPKNTCFTSWFSPPSLHSICKRGDGCVHAGGPADVAQTQSHSLCRASAPWCREGGCRWSGIPGTAGCCLALMCCTGRSCWAGCSTKRPRCP